MIVIYKLSKPYEDLYQEYTGSREITPARSAEITDKMRAKMKERGYIMNKLGRQAFAIPGDSAFDCLTWCIEQSIKDLGKLMEGIIQQIVQPYDCKFTFNYRSKEFTLEGTIREDMIPGIKSAIEDADNKLLRSKFTVSLEKQEQLFQ